MPQSALESTTALAVHPSDARPIHTVPCFGAVLIHQLARRAVATFLASPLQNIPNHSLKNRIEPLCSVYQSSLQLSNALLQSSFACPSRRPLRPQCRTDRYLMAHSNYATQYALLEAHGHHIYHKLMPSEADSRRLISSSQLGVRFVSQVIMAAIAQTSLALIMEIYGTYH